MLGRHGGGTISVVGGVERVRRRDGDVERLERRGPSLNEPRALVSVSLAMEEKPQAWLKSGIGNDALVYLCIGEVERALEASVCEAAWP